MAIRYYDDAIASKLSKWVPENSDMRILKPDEVKQLFETKATDTGDKPIRLPFIALSRGKDIELLSNIKQGRSFDGLRITGKTWNSKTKEWENLGDKDMTALFNVIPIKVQYQLDVYTKTYEESDEFVRELLFKLINNPTIMCLIPYHNDGYMQHIANLRVLSTVSDTSDIGERLFNGQFTRWSIQLELQDGFLFSLPYKRNWIFDAADLETTDDFNESAKKKNVEEVAQIRYDE